MEESHRQMPNDKPLYWQSVFIVGFIFALIIAIGQLLEGYVSINSGTPTGWMGTVFCLLTAFGGFTAVWHYLTEHEISITLGKGALIGFIVGVIAQIVGLGLVEIWGFIDPSYAEGVKQIQIAAIENNEGLPEAWKQSSIDMIHDPGLGMTLLTYGGISIFAGVLNLLTGMLGAKVFSNKEQQI